MSKLLNYLLLMIFAISMPALGYAGEHENNGEEKEPCPKEEAAPADEEAPAEEAPAPEEPAPEASEESM